MGNSILSIAHMYLEETVNLSMVIFCFICKKKLVEQESYSLEITTHLGNPCLHWNAECFTSSRPLALESS